eukprot:7386105-Prymnesium_polylepis.1
MVRRRTRAGRCGSACSFGSCISEPMSGSGRGSGSRGGRRWRAGWQPKVQQPKDDGWRWHSQRHRRRWESEAHPYAASHSGRVVSGSSGRARY